MRIAILSDFGHVSGGAAKVAIDSARGLAEAGHDVVFLHAIAPADDRLVHSRIEPVLLPFPDVWTLASRAAAARRGVWNAEAGRQVAAALFARRAGLDAVHAHQWTKAFSPAVIAAAGRSGVPVFVTLHDYFAFCPQGNYFNAVSATRCALRPMSLACVTTNCDRSSYAHKLVRVARQAGTTRAFAGCADLAFVHVSATARRFAEPHLPARARHVTVDNMVDVAAGPPADAANNRHVLFLGRLTAEKGPHLLAAAAREAGIRVRFVGDGPMRDAVLAANPAAEITGWLPAEAAQRQLEQARALIAPSLWPETGPLTVLEAMGRGVPPVAAAGLGASARITDGVDGLLLPPGDVAALAAALRRLADDAFVRALGAAAHAGYWRDPLDTRRHVARLVEAYSGGRATGTG